jgi:hypothetical protein
MKLATAAAMNVTTVEADDARSVFSPASGEGVAGCDWETDENVAAGALPGKVRDADAPFACAKVACGSGLAHLYRTKRAAVTQKKPTNRPRNNRQNSSSLREFATSASVVVNGSRTLMMRRRRQQGIA